jgi:predicted Zn-dependent peptidase
VQRTLAECVRLTQGGITPDELERAKRQSRTSLVFSQESTSSRMFTLAYQAVHMDGLRSLDEQIQEIDDVDLDQVQRVAREIFHPESCSVAALGTRRGGEIRARDLA